MPYGRRIGLKTAALASRSGHAEVRSGEMMSVEVERSAEVDVGRPQGAVPLPDGRRVPRGPVPLPDMLLWSAVPALVRVETVWW